jgi:hypothetical protein
VHTKAVSQVVFNTLSPFIVCKIENIWFTMVTIIQMIFYEKYYFADIWCCMLWN